MSGFHDQGDGRSPWTLGLRVAAGRDEGDFGGGPVLNWCCSAHSISGPEETLARVSSALVEWRGWLEDLAERFGRYPLAGLSSAAQVAVWEREAVHLIHYVVDRTGAGDAWYRLCAQVLTWFLARWGVAEDRGRHLVGQAISGRKPRSSPSSSPCCCSTKPAASPPARAPPPSSPASPPPRRLNHLDA